MQEQRTMIRSIIAVLLAIALCAAFTVFAASGALQRRPHNTEVHP